VFGAFSSSSRAANSKSPTVILSTSGTLTGRRIVAHRR
jgi:Cft2 family RNA processing exonuclease